MNNFININTSTYQETSRRESSCDLTFTYQHTLTTLDPKQPTRYTLILIGAVKHIQKNSEFSYMKTFHLYREYDQNIENKIDRYARLALNCISSDCDLFDLPEHQLPSINS